VKIKAPAFKFPAEQRKGGAAGAPDSPGPIYGLAGNMGKGPAYTPGTSKRSKKWGEDHRPYSDFALFGSKQGNSLRRSGRKVGFGSYSSRTQPVMFKLDKNW
jgi:hypothetical protein